MALVAAAILFGVFAANVVAGAFLGGAFLGDVTEMLILLATSVVFVAAVLKREARAGMEPSDDD